MTNRSTWVSSPIYLKQIGNNTDFSKNWYYTKILSYPFKNNISFASDFKSKVQSSNLRCMNQWGRKKKKNTNDLRYYVGFYATNKMDWAKPFSWPGSPWLYKHLSHVEESRGTYCCFSTIQISSNESHQWSALPPLSSHLYMWLWGWREKVSPTPQSIILYQ